VKILKPGVSPDVLDCANKLNYRALVFLYFIIGKEQISDNHWLYFPEGKYLFNRISESKVFSENMSPAGKTSLCIEISCNVGDNIYNAAPQELLAQTIDGLEEVGLVKRHEIIDFFMHKEAYAYPIYDFSYKENLKTVMSYVERIENLFSIGRQGLFRYNNMDHSIEMGFKTAEAIINGGKLDTTWVAMKDEYFG
jgi:protoporphyrinogen oxidase